MKSSAVIVNESLLESVREAFLKSASDVNSRLTEEGLCKQHGVSRGTMREVMRHLEHQGFIERKRRTGSRVRRLSIKELVDLWDARYALESISARLACSHITEEEIQDLHDLIARRVHAAKRGDLATIDKTDIDFHERIIAASRNGVIQNVVRDLHLFDRLFHLDYPVPSFWMQDENAPYGHNKIIAALAARDPDKAEDLVRRHIAEAKKRRIEALIGRIDLLEEKMKSEDRHSGQLIHS